MKPVNILFHLYAGDPTKGHDGWMCSVTFNFNGEEVRLPGIDAFPLENDALLDARRRFETRTAEKPRSNTCSCGSQALAEHERGVTDDFATHTREVCIPPERPR